MKQAAWIGAGVLAALLGSAGVAYFLRTHSPVKTAVEQPGVPKVERPAPAAPVPPPPPPPPPQRLETPVKPAPALPPLEKSDRVMLDALSALIGNKTLMRLFDSEEIIAHIVSTIDNLPRRRLPSGALPVESPAGKFLVAGSGDETVASPDNGARYAPYMRLVEAANPRKVVALYVRFYPLFQKAYESMGYPTGYFNDRVLQALDDLMAAPEISGPIALVRPKVFYQYADPDLEMRSAGQKILMRIGLENERKVKERLKEIRKELSSYLHSVQAPAPSKP